MADVFSKKERSRIMSKIRSKDTKVEQDLCGLVSAKLYPRGYRYRRNYKGVFGRPDIAFIAQKIAVFIDGDFWHGRNFKRDKSRLPKIYWRKKIETNITRDRKNRAKLKRQGWIMLRVWERDIKRNPIQAIDRIENFLKIRK